jgi:hypothetical protein
MQGSCKGRTIEIYQIRSSNAIIVVMGPSEGLQLMREGRKWARLMQVDVGFPASCESTFPAPRSSNPSGMDKREYKTRLVPSIVNQEDASEMKDFTIISSLWIDSEPPEAPVCRQAHLWLR